MAKKKKRAAAKKKEEPKKNSGFWRLVSAITVIISGVVLAFGAFIDAPVPKGFWDGTWAALGIATVLAPICLVYLGGLKLFSDEHKIPFPNFVGAVALLVFFASFAHTTFATIDASGIYAGGHGGAVGQSVGGFLLSAMGKFLSSLVFFLLSVFAFLFAFGIEPKVLLALTDRLVPQGAR
jgi:hypothetical protein